MTSRLGTGNLLTFFLQCTKLRYNKNIYVWQSVHAVDLVQRNGEGPFRLGGPPEGGGEGGEEGGCRLPLYPPPGEGATLPLYPPPGDSTLGKVNIVIFSGIGIFRPSVFIISLIY